jgi:hypothetical protein
MSGVQHLFACFMHTPNAPLSHIYSSSICFVVSGRREVYVVSFGLCLTFEISCLLPHVRPDRFYFVCVFWKREFGKGFLVFFPAGFSWMRESRGYGTDGCGSGWKKVCFWPDLSLPKLGGILGAPYLKICHPNKIRPGGYCHWALSGPFGSSNSLLDAIVECTTILVYSLAFLLLTFSNISFVLILFLLFF